MRRDLRKLSITNRTLGAQSPATTASKRWFEITNLADSGVAEIKLRGYIGMPTTERDWMTGELVASGGAGTLQEFETELEALGTVKKIQLSIFSEGGDVFTGMAIHNLLVRHPAKKTAVIDGICASAATYPALACQEVQIPANAWMMIHGSEGCVCGNAQELRDYADMLDSVNASIINLYVARTGKTAEEITAMIEEETWMDGAKAVELGFADTVIEPLQNLASRAATIQPTNAAVLRHAPAEVLALFDMSTISNAARVPLPIAPMQTTAPAPTNAAPSTTAPAVSAAPVQPAAPVVEAPAAPTNSVDLATQITNAVNAAVAPLQAEITRISNLATHGVTAAQLGGAQPTPGTHAPAASKVVNRAQFAVMNAFDRSAFIKSGGKITE
jgi:ATP-dependent protease ClpP protease subunit